MITEIGNRLRFPAIRVNSSNDLKGNFVSLPSSIVQTLESTGIAIQEFGITISFNGKELLHLGWNGYESQGYLNGQPSIDINPILADEVDLVSGVLVDLTIDRFESARTAKEVYVEPATSDDWEIIESHAMFFQDEILHQTRIMTKGEILLCYVDNVVSRFKVTRIVPETLHSARVNTGSLIVVSPRENLVRAQKNHARSEHRKLNLPNKEFSTLHSSVKRSLRLDKHTTLTGMKILLRSKEIKSKFAIISILHNTIEFKRPPKQEKSAKYATKVLVEVESDANCENIPEGHIKMSELSWNSLSLMEENGTRVNVDFLNEECSFSSTNHMKVIVRPLMTEKEYLAKIEKQSLTEKHDPGELAPEDVRKLFASLNGSLLSNRMIFCREQVLLEIIDDTGKHIPFTKFIEHTTSWQYSSKDAIKLTLPKFVRFMDDSHFIEDAFKRMMLEGTEMIPKLCDFLDSRSTPSNCMLIEGSSGMGKTTILKEITKKVSLEEGKYVKYINCDSLADSSNLSKMKQLLQDCCSVCYWHNPSVLLLDNADSLFPNAKSEDPQQQALLQRGGSPFTRLALHLINLVERISNQDSNAIKVIMTTSNRNSVNKAFFDKHFIFEILKRNPLYIDERTRIIEFFFANNHSCMSLSEDFGFRDIALETEGYSPLDLETLTEKLFHEATLRANNCDEENLVVGKELCISTIKSFTPSALRGVKLTKSTGITWEDIGALSGPKKLLLETLEWPTKYAPIFKECPLQLRSGVLLYGYPGCGKTLLASAVAQQCGLNFITVKGPEVLNKYIGASEQNIRDLFDRAQSVKPCILFFDEFDSIAPKRGHDSTGVTDRIVNQLLTQMDGVEGLDGVYVLAATSRPDLIDSALLRPGRIDKSVLCNIPDTHDRLAILRAVASSGKMNIAENADLTTVAENTVGYSGADLQGLCYNAYLKAIHRHTEQLKVQSELDQARAKARAQHKTATISELLDYAVVNAPSPDCDHHLQHILQCIEDETLNSDRATAESGPTSKSSPRADNDKLPDMEITTHDLLSALDETRPSISSSEFSKLRAIYNTFRQDRDGDMPSGDNSNEIGTRISLM